MKKNGSNHLWVVENKPRRLMKVRFVRHTVSSSNLISQDEFFYNNVVDINTNGAFLEMTLDDGGRLIFPQHRIAVVEVFKTDEPEVGDAA